MRTLFIDTWGWISLFNRKEPQHRQVANLYLEVRHTRGMVVTTDYVLDEVHTLLFKRLPVEPAMKAVETISKSVENGHVNLVWIRNDEKYKKRFLNFSEHFYKKITEELYPQEYAEQAIIYKYDSIRILFLGLNSCWEIDHHFKTRAEINSQAFFNAMKKLIENKFEDWLKIAVLHHPVTGTESLKDLEFLDHLSAYGFQIIMHGHIHESIEGYHKYDEKRGIRIIGAGTFGAPLHAKNPGIPYQYNLIRYKEDDHEIEVLTRRKDKPDSKWYADSRWIDKINDPKPWYTFKIKNLSSINREKNTIQKINGDKSYHSISCDYHRPGGTIDRNSGYYIFRETDERVGKSLAMSRSNIVLFGPKGTGKSSLLMSVYNDITHSQRKIRVVFIDFEILSNDSFQSSNKIWMTISNQINNQLKVAKTIDWNNKDQHANNFENFLVNFMNETQTPPLLLCIDNVDHIMNFPIRSEFFNTIKSFYNQGAFKELWRKIMWLMGMSSEPFFFFEEADKEMWDITFGFEHVNEFDIQDMLKLSNQFGFDDKQLINCVFEYIGGHPYIVQCVFHALANKEIINSEIYGLIIQNRLVREYLGRYLIHFNNELGLKNAMKNIIDGNGCKDTKTTLRLQRAGLVRSNEEGKIVPYCKLYADYFRKELF